MELSSGCHLEAAVQLGFRAIPLDCDDRVFVIAGLDRARTDPDCLGTTTVSFAADGDGFESNDGLPWRERPGLRGAPSVRPLSIPWVGRLLVVYSCWWLRRIALAGWLLRLESPNRTRHFVC
jgi:hypothetical protein